ncbi:MAG: hypothetical protein KGJ57_14810 [Sphingomonadales bacterium]|nr:hypothetical protein [Sphingomonadales bacterium]MDE2170674.1 hypothetical protein [Sphingomonadales bacterium]
MAIRQLNLIRRGDTFYYRASFSLDGKVSEVRLSLKTGDRRVARQRAIEMDRLLRSQWQRLSRMNEGISPSDRLSILREGAIRARDAFEQVFAVEQHDGYDDADEVQRENLRTLRSMDLVVRDIFAHGLGPSFGTHDHFHSRFVEGMPDLSLEDGVRVQEILFVAEELRTAIQKGAHRALVRRNLEVTPANLTLARQQMMAGVALAMRDLQKEIAEPHAKVDDILASLSLDDLIAGAGRESDQASQPAPPPPAAPPPAARDMAPAAAIVLSEPVTPSASAMSIRQASEAFLAANPKLDADVAGARWTPKTRSQFEAAIFLADKHFGSTADIRGIEETQLANFFRVLRKLPSSHHKTPAHAGMTLAEIGAANNGDGLSLATTNRHMRFLKAVFQWVAKRTPGAPIIEWSAFIEADTRLKRDKRDAFKVDELEKLFHGPVWSGSDSRTRRLKPGHTVFQDACYWIPLLLTYTGARREEVSKAMVQDVELIDGIWCLRIRVSETGRVKNVAAVRDVPVATELRRLGFLEFVEGVRAEGHSELFPELSTGGATYGDAFYKRWWRAFMRADLVPMGKDMHSIRHFVAVQLGIKGVSEERRADLLGHTLDSSETVTTYSERAPLELLLKVVDTIPLVTRHLKRMPLRRP